MEPEWFGETEEQLRQVRRKCQQQTDRLVEQRKKIRLQQLKLRRRLIESVGVAATESSWREARFLDQDLAIF
jgi:hypothetical protein